VRGEKGAIAVARPGASTPPSQGAEPPDHASTVVQAPIADVFAIVPDMRNNVLWRANAVFQSTQRAPEDVVGVGKWIAEVWRFMGRNAESDSEVVNYEPNRTYTRRLIAGTSPLKERTVTFESDIGGTRRCASRMRRSARVGGAWRRPTPRL
jgi:hypothetical protein